MSAFQVVTWVRCHVHAQPQADVCTECYTALEVNLKGPLSVTRVTR